jgi:hypothetical protein
VAVPPVRAVELERFESTFNRARIGGAVITFLLGPFFPTIGIEHVILFGLLLIAQFGFVTLLLRSGRFRRQPEGTARVIFAIDLCLIAYAILLFSSASWW